MSSEFNGSYESYLFSPLEIDSVDGDFTRYDAPFLYHYEDSFPMLDIEPATETVNHELLEHSHHPLPEECSSAGASELGFAPNQFMLQNTGFDADASYEIGHSDGELCPLFGDEARSGGDASHITASTNENPVPLDHESWRCPWLSCSIVLSNHFKEAITSHFDDHRTIDNPLPGKWSPLAICNWSKCSSKAVFKTPSSYRTHMYNIHISPLICDVPECSYVKPFGKRCDLNRHKSTAHGDAGQVECPIQGCDTKARKDKLQEHMRKYHQKLRCPYNHCTTTVIEGQEDAHMKESHGTYECGLGACEAGLQSRFQLERLKRHARNQHGVDYWTSLKPNYDLEKAPDKTLRADMYQGKRSTKKDCVECLAKLV